MAPKSKPKKKTKNAKSGARAKTKARPAQRAAKPSGADETSEALRASAKSFAARLLR